MDTQPGIEDGELPTRRERAAEFRERLVEAAIEAERQTGQQERTRQAAERHIAIRMVRTVVGFLLVFLGIGAMIGPGPGPLIIIIGLSMLPYLWAQRAVTEIRRRTPGIPEDGRVPARTWFVIAAMITVYATVAIVWGDDISSWIAGLWGDPEKLLT